MHTSLDLTSTMPLRRRASPLISALTLALIAPGCVLDITDFKESASAATSEPIGDASSDGSTSDASASDSSTSDSGTSVASTTTTTNPTTTTGDTGDSGEFPACYAYTQDPETGDAEACAAELGCADFTDSGDCMTIGYYNDEAQMGVECRWGNLLFDATYIEAEQLCDGNVTGVCRAAVFLGEGGPPCFGFYNDLGDTLEVLNLGCGTPITGDWEACYVDGGDAAFPPCDDCFPQLF